MLDHLGTRTDAITDASKEQRVAGALATLAGTLTSDYDLVQLLHTVLDECIDLVDAQAAGLLLENAHGELELVASTSEAAGFVEVMQLNAGDGPCIECARTGDQVSIADIEAAGGDWAQFREAALLEGFHSSYGVPLKIRSEVIGAIGLYRTETGDLSLAEVGVAQALADLASIGIVQERALRERGMVTEQLQRALDSRVFIEQAKGVVAATADVDMEEAFRMLREHAHSNDLKMHAVAELVVTRKLRLTQVDRARG